MLLFALMAAFSAGALFAQPNSQPRPPSPVIHVCFAGCSRGEGMTLVLENGPYVADKGREGIALKSPPPRQVHSPGKRHQTFRFCAI